MTERLYYRDSFLREFDAQVLSCESEGDRWKVILDRTAFYPTSGGQPCDLGRLGDAAVLEIVEDAAGAENKQIIHYTSVSVPVGAVRGQIDWTRRRDHMQQHTGQHLLSAAFMKLFQFRTVSFHLGREVSTIDLDAPAIVPRQLEEAERLTNEIILEDRIVAVRFGTAEELAEEGIRKQVDREGVLRAIEIEGFDRQPCGGTHLARTGQAGLLLIRKTERRRESWRVEYVCGFRALAAAREGFATLTQLASLMSCGFPDLPAVLARMIEERRGLHGSVKRLEGRLAEQEARTLLAGISSQNPGDARVVVAVIEDARPGYLVLLTASLTARAGVVALVASRSSGHVVFAQSKGLSGDMGVLLRATLNEFGGKGGGPKDFAQGSVADGSVVDKLLARARDLVAM